MPLSASSKSCAPILFFLLLLSFASPGFASPLVDDDPQIGGSPASPPTVAATCTVPTSGSEHVLRGVVTDASSAPVPDAVLSVSCGSFHREARSGSDGSYSLSLPLGSFTIALQANGFAEQQRTLDMGSSDVKLNLSLVVDKLKTTVSVHADPGYLEQQSSYGTKTDTPLLEVPQVISVVSRKLLDDQGAIKLDDAIHNVAGVVPGGYYDGYDYYRIRGFDASFNTFLDGLRGANGTQDETYGLESIEVLKGPSSALYGQSVLGGVVNLTSKRPVPDAFANLDFVGGSFGLYTPSADVGGSINKSHSLYGRLVALYRGQDSFTDYAYSNRLYLAPSLTWRIDHATSLTLLTRYQRDHVRPGYPLPAEGTILYNPSGNIPISRYLGELGDDNNTVREENKHYGYLFSHSFNDSVVFHQTMRIDNYRETWHNLLYPGSLSDDGATEYRYPLDYLDRWRDYAVDSILEASFHTGSIRHTFVAGYDFYRKPETFSGESIDLNDLSAYLPLNLINPVYGAATFPATKIPAYGGQTLVQYSGIYLQDQVHLTPKLIVTGGGRFNFATNRTYPDPGINKYAFTPRIGVTYLLRSDLSAFADYSRSFLPQSGQVYSETSTSGVSASPEEGHQYEVGLKSNLLSNKLNASLALFDLTRSNVLTTDVLHPSFNIQSGQQRSQGVEFETSSTLRSGWIVTAAYAYTFARVVSDNSIPLGTPTINAPKNMFSFWTHYEFQRGWERGIGLGVGTRYYTREAGDLNNSFQLPQYGVTDASISYARGPFHVQLNGYNMGDREYYTGSYNNLYVKPGAPRAARVSVGWHF